MKDTTDYESFKKYLELKEFVELKTDTIEFLVQGKGILTVCARDAEGLIYVFDVQVRHPTDNSNPYDCKIGNLTLNRFFRTKKGVTGERYESFSAMLTDIKKGMKSKLGADAVSYAIIRK